MAAAGSSKSEEAKQYSRNFYLTRVIEHPSVQEYLDKFNYLQGDILEQPLLPNIFSEVLSLPEIEEDDVPGILEEVEKTPATPICHTPFGYTGFDRLVFLTNALTNIVNDEPDAYSVAMSDPRILSQVNSPDCSPKELLSMFHLTDNKILPLKLFYFGTDKVSLLSPVSINQLKLIVKEEYPDNTQWAMLTEHLIDLTYNNAAIQDAIFDGLVQRYQFIMASILERLIVKKVINR